MSPTSKKQHDTELRTAAELQLASEPERIPSSATSEAIMHDLHVHQIELEMQNESLRQAKVALEESRDRYHDLYEFAPVGYITLSFEGIITNINQTGARMLGTLRKHILRRCFSTFLAPRDQTLWPKYLQALKEETGKSSKLEIRMQPNNGPQFDALLDCTSSPDKQIRLTVSDISERKKMEEQLILARAEAEHANQAKSHFLAAASHDLRQPLAALRLYTDTLLLKAPENQRTLLTGMNDCVANLSGLLNDLLDLSKLDAGVVKPNISSFPLATFLGSLESVFSIAAKEKGLDLRFRHSALIGHTDPVLLKRIVGNMIDNAIRYTSRGGVLVACRQHAGKTWIEVRDSGIGIPADQIKEVFEDFKQLGDGARNRGSGLGLAIVAKTAALLGLAVRVASRPARGSVFAIEVPLGERAQTTPGGIRRAKTRALSVALVEDNPMVREALEFALQDLGHQVLAAPDGHKLLAQLDKHRPDIIISDYRLAEGETGFDVITSVRSTLGTKLPALIITGDTDPKLLAYMAEQDVRLMHKPFDIGKFKSVLADLTEHSE